MTAQRVEPETWEVAFKLSDGSEVVVEVSSVNALRAERRALVRFAKLHPQEAFLALVTRVTAV